MAKSGKIWLKRAAVGLAGLIGVLIAAAVIIPLVVDIDRYRPEIVKAANQHINGELKIGELSMSLWGQVEIDIDGIQLADHQGEQVIAVEETYAQISFLSILSGEPKLIFRMVRPEVSIIKDEQGKLNVLDLVKKRESADRPPPASDPSEQSGDVPMVDLLHASGVDVELVNAQVQFKDLATGFVQDVEDLNINLVDVSMSRPTQLRIWADISTRMADVIALNGPLQISGTITPEFQGAQFEQVAVDLALDFDQIGIDMGETLQKPAGLATNMELKMVASSDFINVTSLVARFHNAELRSSAKLTKLQSPSPVVDFKLKSQPVDLSEWGKLVTALKGLELEGRMDMAATANGPLDKISYTADLDIQNLLANAPGLQERPKMQLAVKVVTNAVESLSFDFEAPGTDLAVRGSLKDFYAPEIKMQVTSKAIDIDQLLPPPATEPAKGSSKTEQEKSAERSDQSDQEPSTNVDEQLEPLRTNEFLKSLVAYVSVDIGKFNGMNINASDIDIDLSLRDLVGSIDNLNLNIWKGLIKANANIDFKPSSPLYRMNANVHQIDLETAVESQLEALKNTLRGRLSFKASGSGKSLNSDQMLKNLDMTGSFKVENAVFATIDVGRMVVGAINEGLEDIKKKVPPLADKKIRTPENFRSRYEEISSSFTLKAGVFTAPNFRTTSIKNEGIDLEGRTVADLAEDKLDADWLIVDTYNITGARNLAVNMNGVSVDHILAKDREPVKFPVKVGCKLSEPCYQYDQVAKYLADIALDNVRKAAGKRINKEVDKAKERARQELEKQKAESRKEAEKRKQEAEKKLKDKAEEEAKKLKKRFGF